MEQIQINWKRSNKILISFFFTFLFTFVGYTQGTRLLRQPSLHQNQVAFAYGSDIWVSDVDGNNIKRITSTPAVEKDPFFSPDGNWIAFTSNRAGSDAVFVVSVNGGEPKRLTWHPSASKVRGWTNDGNNVLFASSRDVAPGRFDRLFTISINGGPATLISNQWGTNGSYSANGKKMAIDRMSRWDWEFRAYRGGQNTPLILLDLASSSEELIPNQKTTDTHPYWEGNIVYFISDRDLVKNIWAYNTQDKSVKQITKFEGSDIKSLSGFGTTLVYERDGYIHTYDTKTNQSNQLNITVVGDFSWAETKWQDVTNSGRSASLSSTGKRIIMESRGDIFTIPVKDGDVRNMTQTSTTADRAPLWSPNGNQIAWFSDGSKKGYSLLIADQDGMSNPKIISIGVSKMAWEPTWSPDGKHIAFTDDDVRIQVVEVATGTIQTADVGGNNLERGSLGLTWSHDSNWLAYAKSGTNNFKQIYVWSLKDGKSQAITNSFANSFSPAWDRDNKHLYFLASTDVALGSGWANTSAMTANPVYAAYVMNLNEKDASPFEPKSDEEKEKEEKSDDKKKPKEEAKKEDKKKDSGVQIDFDGIDRRIMALGVPQGNYRGILAGPKETIFILEYKAGTRGITIQKYSLKDQEAKEFAGGASNVSISNDGKKLLARINNSWKLAGTAGPNAKSAKSIRVRLEMKLNRQEEWNQMFEEAWRYERDYFYDPNLHGRDWDVVYKRYAPLVPFVKHRADLTYILDQMNGELSVGHSFVFGGDFPSVDRSKVGLLGANLVASNNRWKIERIFTSESWNPNLSAPLDRPGTKIEEGHYIVGINGKELTASMNPYQFLDGTQGKQTVLHINDKPAFSGAWKETVKPIRSENSLRQRAWVEDNRRMVDELSGGKLAYVWVPNTGGPGFMSFNRYFFAQQDKEGAVIDERFNGGGLLDDYMVDLMTRSLRAGLTNEVPNGKAMRLPAGILGPKVLLINELAGSGGDFFPWVFRQQKAGKLIGATTWGGLVKSSVHYSLMDGGALTAPDNAVFDPVNGEWVGENKGIAPDIEVRQDAKSLSKGRDPQLERAVKELLDQLKNKKSVEVKPPAFSTPAKKKGN